MIRKTLLFLLLTTSFISFCQEMGFTVGPIGPATQEVSTLYFKPVYMDSCMNCDFPNDPDNDWTLSTSLSDKNFDIFVTEFKKLADSLDCFNLDPNTYSVTPTAFKFYNLMGGKVSEYVISDKDTFISLLSLMREKCAKHTNFDFYGMFGYLIVSYEHIESLGK